MIYLDQASTTFIDDTVIDVISRSLKTYKGNPSSTHKLGFDAVKTLNQTKTKIGSYLKASLKQLIFTSSGTEANNLVIQGIYQRYPNKRYITSKIEHSSVLHTFEYLENLGADVYYVKVNEEGFVDIDDLTKALNKDTALVSLMMINNELGTLEDIQKIAEICHRKNALLHSDMVQVLMHKSVNLEILNVDFATFSAHKFHGPKGVGLVYAKDKTLLSPLIQGGAQEFRLRPGTENVAYAEGFLKALEITEDSKEVNGQKIDNVVLYFLQKLETSHIAYKINGPTLKGSRIKATLNLALTDIDATRLKFYLETHDIYVSLGSACNAKSVLPSHVLSHLYRPSRVSESLRFSFGPEITKTDVDVLIKAIASFIQNKT